MYFYKSETTNPYFNIAAEEYFLKHFEEDFFYLYVNEPSIVVGKHQNTVAEINVHHTIENDLKVVRRLSGGGTVYHDKGNVNYCFIKKGAAGQLVDFKKYTQPVLDTLNKLGVPAKLRGKSDLVIGDKKFSGNAEHVFRNKILHHGTMLFNSELDALNNAIKADWNKFTDKAVRSNRSVVTNISEHMDTDFSIENFTDAIANEVLLAEDDVQLFSMSTKDVLAIQQLINEKYSKWEWNYGYSPTYVFNQHKEFNGSQLAVNMQIKKGVVTEIEIKLNEGDYLNDLADLIINSPHDYYKLKTLLDANGQILANCKLSTKQVLSLLF